MSHTYVADCSDSGKDDTLIIIVNSDGTLSVDPETLQKLLANQHHTSPISLVRIDNNNDRSGGSGDADENDDPDSRVNLTVEGYFPPTPAPSSPTPPPTPVADSNITTEGGSADILSDSITEILQPEDVEKLETALQSEHAKEILGDVVLDMLQQNGEDAGLGDEVMVSQHGSVVLDHCYASLTGPSAQSSVTPPIPVAAVVATQSARGATRGRGRGRGGLVQTKLTLASGASMVPVVQQLVMPGSLMAMATSQASAGNGSHATVNLQRLNLQVANVVPCKVMLNKVPMQTKPATIAQQPIGGGGDIAAVQSIEEGDIATPKKKVGRGRGVLTRGRGTPGVRGRGQGRGRGVPKISEEEQAKNKRLAEEMAATVRALTLAEQEQQFASIESMDVTQTSDADRVIPLVNKQAVKKPIKVYKRAIEVGPKVLKVLKPEKTPQKTKAQRKSLSSESSHDEKPPTEKKEEKVIVVSMEPQITAGSVSAVVMSQISSQPTVIPPTPAPTIAPTPATPNTGTKKYPKRENRKPPAHLAEAFGPALFSTPDIIRRVSTDKQCGPLTPGTPVTPAPPQTQLTPTTPSPVVSATAKLEDELGLSDNVVETDGIMDTINSQVSKQEDQLIAEALSFDDLSALPTEDILQEEMPPQQLLETLVSPTTVKKPPPKNKKQMSLSAFFPVVNETKDENNEMVENASVVAPQTPSTIGLRKLPPVELPATRGATKRASLQKDQIQDKKPEEAKKVINSTEKRKSTDSKKSTESRKSSGRSLGDESEEMLVSDEVSDEEGSYNSEDDPNRLWCICKRPHNNRFMICCDVCEDWFHGKCVGITKAMGEQMEEQEIEWVCPNCKKKKKQEEVAKKQGEGKGGGLVSPKIKTPEAIAPAETPAKEKKTEVSKVMVQQQKLVVLSQDTPKNVKGSEIRITKVSTRKSTDESRKSVDETPRKSVDEVESTSAVEASLPAEPVKGSGEECIVCKKEALHGGVYCSDECIAQHTTESLKMIDKSAVIVFEKKTGRIYGGPNAPTPSTLTSWLMAHPSYQVMRPGVLPSSKFYNQSKPGPRPQSQSLKQTVLQTRPQGIQLIAALPQLPPPLEGPLKKNLAKAEPIPSGKAKQQAAPIKGQQQITQMLKPQPKPEPEVKPSPAKIAVTPPTPAVKKPVKETKKTPQPPPPVKKTTPVAVKKTAKEEPKEQKKEEGRGKDYEEQLVRASVKKTLQEVLMTRLQETMDLKLSDEQIKKLTTQIEEELYGLFKETNAKYKAKYRSLMFNIKDKNNLTLFRKIADKSLSPVQLVRLTPEELASQELAQWREREARHQLEMIKKTELDLMQQAKTVVMKTHKGEQIVENEDGLGAKVLETSVEIEPVETPVTPTAETPPVKPKVKEDKQSKKGKKEDKHKERRHSSHKNSHKDDRSRSRHRSRHTSGSDRRSRSKSKTQEAKGRSRSRSVEEPKDKDKSEIKERGRSKSRPPDRSRSRHREERSKSKPRSKSRIRSKSGVRGRSKSRPRERSKSRPRERSKSRGKSQIRSRSKSRPRERSKSRPRRRSTDTEKNGVEEEKTSMEKLHEDIDIPVKPAIFDSEIKEIIHDVVEEEETGQEVEDDLSDREPSSTVNISTPPFNVFDEEEESAKPPVWRGTLIMPDVAKFSCSIQEVSGVCGDLEFDLPDTIDCVGRISPETAWDYIAKMKKSGTKQILVIRFTADNEEDKMSYLSFYSYLSSRSRLGVVGNNSKMIKDFYILPLPSHSPVPQVLLPLDGPGFEDYRPHLLLGIIVRMRRKRTLTDRDIPFIPKVAKKSERSYTPPLPDEDSHTPTQQQHPATESFTPPHSPKPPRIIKLKNRKISDSPTVSDDYVLEDADTPYTPEDTDAPYSPGDGQGDADDTSRSDGCSAELQRKVDQLNRMINDIEQRKQKIDSMTTIPDLSSPQEIMITTQEEDEGEEAYSPSGSITPPATDTSYLDKSSSKISLPSDLQEIIASIKKKPEEPKPLDLKSDPIVQAYRSADEPYSPEEDKDEDEAEERVATPISEESFSPQSSVPVAAATTVKVNRDPRQRQVQLSLNQLSDEEVIKKASEMGFMNPENPDPIPDKKKTREPPPPGVEEEYDPFAGEKESNQQPPVMPLQPPPNIPPSFLNQPPFPASQPFNPDFPPPPHFAPPNFPPPGQFQDAPFMFQGQPMEMPPLPPSHIPFTNPQPPQPMYPQPPPPPQPAPPLPPPPSEPPSLPPPKKKFPKKSKKKKDKKEKKEKRRYSESPPPKDYDDKFDRSRDRDRYSIKKREKKDSGGGTWRLYDKEPIPEKRRESWEYEGPREYEGPPPIHPPPQVIPGPPPHTFSLPGPMRGGPPMRGRFQRGMRGFRRGFDRPPMRGFHRGGFRPPMGPLHPGPSRGFPPPKTIHNEIDEDIRRFEEQRKQQKNLVRRRWRESSPRKRRNKDGDSD